MVYSILMKEANWINDLKDHKILLFIWVFSIRSLQFQVMDKEIFTSLQFIDYKLIAFIIFEELAPVVFYNVRSLPNPPNAYFSYDFCFVDAKWEFESRFPIFHEILYLEDDSINSNS